MRLDRLQVKNFRNLADLDLKLLPSTVIVGENRSGKSNLVHAIRLVLDPRMSYADRQLSQEDFWEGLSDGSDDWDPMTAGEVIEISVDIIDFEHSGILVTALSDALIEEDPMRARLTYRFGPIEHEATKSAKKTYRGEVLGGQGKSIDGDLRSFLTVVFLQALRDVQSDIRTWRKSPLRSLLESAAAAVHDGDMKAVHDAMVTANQAVNRLESVTALASQINDQMRHMVGNDQALQTELAVAPDDPQRLIRSMRIFVDGDARRNLGSSSLGAQNVLYLALLELGLQQRLTDRDIAHVIMTIEEPEAHLHPHLQRLMFRQLLSNEPSSRTAILTTHSPQIVSVADPKSIVALRCINGETRASEAHRADLSDEEWADVGRYLDVTRAELVFARRVLFVEGYGEQALLPSLADQLDMNLDKLGVTVCAVHGTHFGAYARFCRALDIPWAVITDGDPGQKVTGEARAAALMTTLNLKGGPEENGIFVGDHTFEYDLVLANPANVKPCFDSFAELVKEPSKKVVEGWGTAVPSLDDYIKMIKNAGGKGRFAQRLSLQRLVAPTYVASALEYLNQA